ncbi:MAG: hypothetical protein M3N43_06620 [Actinomycetota bacterium]|nr:hypothetical protein [Actinomycetota bacterium]
MATVSALSRTSSAAGSSASADVVRHDDARLSDSRNPTAHNHSAADINTGTLSAARLPLVQDPPVALTYASGLTPDAAAGNVRECTLTGDATLNPPTNPAAAQRIQLSFVASGAQRVLTFASGIRRFTDLAGSYNVPQDQMLRCTLEYSTLLTAPAWVLIAVGVTA